MICSPAESRSHGLGISAPCVFCVQSRRDMLCCDGRAAGIAREYPMHETAATKSFAEPGRTPTLAVTLEVTHGLHAGQLFTFSLHDTFLVGRSRQAHFCLPEK